MKLFNKVGIVGVGLIGGSIGMALKRRGLANEVVGICRRTQNIKQAKKLGAIDHGSLDLEAIKNCDLVILATPVRNIIKTIPKVNRLVRKGCIVIDAGSTKSEIVKTADRFLSRNICFIGTHPLAGSEKKGVGFACSDLFKDSLCLLTPSKKSSSCNLNKIKKLWRALGAKTKVISPAVHDKLISFSSHLPHAVVFSLVDSLPKEAQGFVASGFKDTTRIALSDPNLWQDVFLTNADKLIEAIDKFQISLGKLKRLIKKKNKKSLLALIEHIREKRNAL